MLHKILTAAPAILALSLPVCQAAATDTNTGAKDNCAAKPVHMVLENTELRPLHSDITNRDYQLYIGYPDSYASNPNKHYPVVYLTDAYWSFVKMHSLGSSLWYDQAVPEFIVVGIGYVGENVNYGVERMFELSPSKQDYGWAAQMGDIRMGGSRLFLDSIRDEIIPYVDANLRTDPSYRVMAGSSMGGLFSLFCMYEEPGLFQGVISSSPAVNWDHRWIFNRESQLHSKAIGDNERGTYSVPARLFMCVGSREWQGFQADIKAMDTIISNGNYADFAYEFRVLEGEHHGGGVAEAYNRGLRFVFEPMRPGDGPID
ncbi:MAG: alpha/beta hydrolase [Opitutales bacterium]|nr:alpha/beta hydrolase [Opitutales bacterium]